MKTEKKRIFIINFLYFLIVGTIFYIFFRYGIQLLAPFFIAFFAAYILNRPICFLSKILNLNRKLIAILMVAVFYGIFCLLISMLGIRIASSTQSLIRGLSDIYIGYIQPRLVELFGSIERMALQMDMSLFTLVNEWEAQFIKSVGEMVSSFSITAMGIVSDAAASLPGLFIKLLMMVISTFFIAADYDKLVHFFTAQLNGKTKFIFQQIREYIVETLFVCLRSYLLIMIITFIELSIGLSIIGIDHAILIAALIALFDILPIVGTGGIMIPWAIASVLLGDYSLAFSLLLVYLVITVIRNVLEPKIVGQQLGLHPVITLASMFVGVQLFGGVGLFGFPIGLSLLQHLNHNGTIHIFKTERDIDKNFTSRK